MGAPEPLIQRYLRLEPMSAGQAIFSEPRVPHGSSSNRSGRERIATLLNLLHQQAEHVHYVGDRSRPEVATAAFAGAARAGCSR